MQIRYYADDGTEFKNEQDCKMYEKRKLKEKVFKTIYAKVFPEIYGYSRMRTISVGKRDKILWQRPEVKELTIQEIEDKLGYKVKIVKEKSE